MKLNNTLAILTIIIMIIIISLFVFPEKNLTDYITIKGVKPRGVKVALWVKYSYLGSKCEKSSYDLFNFKVRSGGVNTIKFYDDKFNSKDSYNYAFPNGNYVDEDNCEVKLYSLQIKAYNGIDSKGGFAEFNVISKDDYINHGLVMEAKNCNPNIITFNNGSFFGDMLCDYYMNNELLGKKSTGNIRIHYNLSELKNHDIIYNIYAGKEYTNKKLNEHTGKLE